MIEKYYRRIIDGIPAAVIVADKNLKAVFANAKFKELFIPKSIRTEQNDLKIFKLIGVDAKYAKQLF